MPSCLLWPMPSLCFFPPIFAFLLPSYPAVFLQLPQTSINTPNPSLFLSPSLCLLLYLRWRHGGLSWVFISVLLDKSRAGIITKVKLYLLSLNIMNPFILQCFLGLLIFCLKLGILHFLTACSFGGLVCFAVAKQSALHLHVNFHTYACFPVAIKHISGREVCSSL